MRGGMHGDGHELSILIRVGDRERQGRAPSNVSTMIIRPPQRGSAARARVFSPTVGLGPRPGRILCRGEQLSGGSMLSAPSGRR